MADQVGLPNPEELGALETACGILDYEAERLMRIRDAREEVSLLTGRVREIVAHAREVQARVDSVQTDLAASEQRLNQLQQHELYEQRKQHQQREAWEQEAKAHDQLLAERRAQIEQLDTEHDQAMQEFNAHLDVLRAQQNQAHVNALQEHEAQLDALRAQIRELETQVQTAQRLRDQLTALRS